MKKKNLIIFVLIIIVVFGIWYFLKGSITGPGPQTSAEEKVCIDSGGTVTTANCCKSVSDFPNSCLIGACGCSFDNSREVKICDCGDGCWDGTKCVKNQTDID